MIELVGVVQHYGVRPVLRGLSVQIPAGMVVAVVGPNGMGKTTLMGVMAGILSPQRGQVEIDGLVRRRSVEEEQSIRCRLVYLPDHPWLPVNRTGREWLLAIGRLYRGAPDQVIDHVERLLSLFQLTKEGDWPIRSYSNGQKKKIALASALVTEVPILLLDEPFSGGLDPAGILALREVLRRLGTQPDRTIVMTEPELVESLTHRVLVLREGQVAAFEDLDGLRKLTGCSGTLTEVLARLIHPGTLEQVEQYFAER